jgi:hypothetical protein
MLLRPGFHADYFQTRANDLKELELQLQYEGEYITLRNKMAEDKTAINNDISDISSDLSELDSELEG